MNLNDIKVSVGAALDMRAQSWDGMKQLRIDVRFRDDGSVNQVALTPYFEVNVRGRCPPLEAYDFLSSPPPSEKSA